MSDVSSESPQAKAEVTNKQLDEEVEEGRRVIANLTANIEDSARTITRLQGELIKVNNKILTKSKNLATATLAHSKLETKFKALENEHAELRDAKERIEIKLRSNESHLQSEYNRLQLENQSLADELLAGKVSTDAKTISGLKDELTAIAQLEIKVDDLGSKFNSIKFRVNEEIEKRMRPLRSKVDHVQNRIVKLEGSKADLNRVTSLAKEQMYPKPQDSINKLMMRLLIDSEESKDFRRKHSVDARRTSKKRPNSICCYRCGRMGHSVKSCYFSILKKE
jgi:DNA repair exonuclease SbcCD ATPase subunit